MGVPTTIGAGAWVGATVVELFDSLGVLEGRAVVPSGEAERFLGVTDGRVGNRMAGRAMMR